MLPNGSITVSTRRVLLVENSPSDRQLLRNWLNAEMIETYALRKFREVAMWANIAITRNPDGSPKS